MPEIEATNRQRELVRLLTSNTRCSLNQAMKLSGYGRHNANLAQILRSPAIVALFREAVEQGRILPHDHRERVLEAIAEADLMALR